MDVVDELTSKMAMANIDIAIRELRDLHDPHRFPQTERDFTWAFKCCSYSRFVHIGVWDNRIPPRRVRKEIIPLLKQIETEVRGFAEQYPSTERKNDVKGCADNIMLRRQNLEENYLKGKPSRFPPPTVAPLRNGSPWDRTFDKRPSLTR